MITSIANRRGFNRRNRPLTPQENDKLNTLQPNQNYSNSNQSHFGNSHPILTNKKIYPTSVNQVSTTHLKIDGTGYLITQEQSYLILQLTGTLETSTSKVTSLNPQTEDLTTSIYLVKIIDQNHSDVTLLWSYPTIINFQQEIQIHLDKESNLLALSRVIHNTMVYSSTGLRSVQSTAEYFIAKFNLNPSKIAGTLLWIDTIQTSIDKIPRFITYNDKIYLGGTFDSQVILSELFKEDTLDAATIQSELNTDMFLARIDSDGIVDWIISSGIKTQGEITLDDLTISFINFNNIKLLLTGRFNQILDFDRNNEHLYIETNANNLWVGQFDLEGNINWVNCPQSNSKNNYITVNQILSTGLDIYLTGTLEGEYNFNETTKAITSNNKTAIYLAKMSYTGDFTLIKTLEIDTHSNDESNPNPNPRLIQGDLVYLSFFGLGTLQVHNFNPIKGEGILNLWVTALYYNDLVYPTKIPAILENSNSVLTLNKNKVKIIGTQMITPDNFKTFIKELNID